jgi:regulatory protein
MKEPAARTSKRPARRPKVVDPAFLDAVALAYLNRFDATVNKLRQVLRERARVEARRGEPGSIPSEARMTEWIEALLTRYQGSGLVDDRRYAENGVAQLRARGASRRAIAHKLRLKGLDDSVIEDALGGEVASADGADLEAAERLCKRRRLGQHRKSDRELHRHKDLAVLARAGFSFDIAQRALGMSRDGSDEF